MRRFLTLIVLAGAGLARGGAAEAAGHDVDPFGIQKIYADAPAPSNSWGFTGNPRDPRFMEQHLVAAAGGWFRPEDPAEMRVEVVSDREANEKTIETFDVAKVLAKAVLHRTPAGMKLELYLDMTGRGDRFEKVLEYEDRGEWGPTRGGNAECDCGENVVLSMARVAIGFRCDNLIEFEFKDMSIRSIDPKRPLQGQ